MRGFPSEKAEQQFWASFNDELEKTASKKGKFIAQAMRAIRATPEEISEVKNEWVAAGRATRDRQRSAQETHAFSRRWASDLYDQHGEAAYAELAKVVSG